jgi:hypothetical protein
MLMAAGSASKVAVSMPLVIATGSYLCTKSADEPNSMSFIGLYNFVAITTTPDYIEDRVAAGDEYG